MKTIILSVLLVVSISAYGVISSQGLLAHYNFEDNAQNQVSNSFHLTPISFSGVNLQYVSNGKSGKSVSFSGTNALIESVDYTNFFGESNNHSISVSYWVKFPNAVSMYNKTHFEFFESFFSRNGNFGNIVAGMATDDNGSANWVTSSNHSISSLTANVWHHIVVIYTQQNSSVNDKFRIYINNSLAIQLEAPISLLYQFTPNFILGAGSANGVLDYATKGFVGEIDEMYVFNRVLSTTDIASLNSLKEVAASSVTANNLLAYYPFDVDYKNVFSTDFNLQQSGSSFPLLSASAKQGNSVQFSSDHALFSNEFFDFFNQASDKSFSIAYWARGDNNNTKTFRTSLEFFENIFLRGQKAIGISRTTTDWPIINYATLNNSWNHFAVTYNFNNKEYKVYVDGELRGTVTNIHTLHQYAGMLVVGAGSNNGQINFAQKSFSGNVDELFVFNRVLSEKEIAGLYVLAPLAYEYTVEFSSLDDNQGTVTATVNNVPISSGDKVLEGTNVTFTANPLPGFVVTGWQLNGEVMIFRGGTPSSYSFNINDNTEITLVFSQEPTSIHESQEQLSSVSVFSYSGTRYVRIDALEAIQQIVLLDIAGNVVRVEKGNDSENQVVNVGAIPQGIYIISVTTNSGVIAQKILVN
jgi:hypothetical protein